MDGHDLTLEQAAALAEFEDDPEATSQLLGALERGYSIDHQVQQLRDARAEAAALAAEQDRWRAQGYPVIDRPEQAWTLRLENLRDAQGEPFDPDNYASVEGAAVYLEQDWTYPTDDRRRRVPRTRSRSPRGRRSGCAWTRRPTGTPPDTAPSTGAAAALRRSPRPRRRQPRRSAARSSPTTRPGARPRRSGRPGSPPS